MLTKTGVEEWCAPEILSGAYYTEKIDLWAVGCVAFFTLVGEKPFENINTAKLHQAIAKGEFS